MDKTKKVLSKLLQESAKTYTDEMFEWYQTRTLKHINLVRKYIDKLDMSDSEKELRKENHDTSKFEESELVPYIWITWKYYCLDNKLTFDDYNPPEDLDDIMNNATHHHITQNSHHPEYHSPDKTNLLNRDDRDKPPEEMVDATKMGDDDIKEMCADWSAMSEERGTNTPQEWAKRNVNIRWKFNKKTRRINL